MDEKEIENRELRKAFERVTKAVEGMPKTIEEVEVEIDGDTFDGKRIPLAKVRAGDSKRLAQAVPIDDRSAIIDALLKGTKNLDPKLVVQQQSTCLNHLLAVVAKFIPAEPTPPTPEPSSEPTEPSDGEAGESPA